ncbi:MAG: peptidylprolyl isomerase [Coriobacteriales bacterium]|jgi:FKBP-type peptidyl-prolyl cis-trans isomerase 2|nr:peptidylprolyl isomerase [Coriobacteriales bacterium]
MAKKGSKVKVHYTGTLDDGTVFDSSVTRGEPIEFVVGTGQMIPGFDAAVLEMEPGDKKTVHIPSIEAYGDYREDFIEEVPVEHIPNAEQLPVGEYIVVTTDAGPMRIKVIRIEDGNAYFDHNHELAGENLNFEIELLEVAAG